jgi:hypothetical protein
MRAKSVLPPVFVIGSARSGTTWIGETIASCARCIQVFEPMHPNAVVGTPPWPVHRLLPGPYVPVGGSHPEWVQFFDRVLAGRISNSWTRQDWTRLPRSLERWSLLERVGYRLVRTQYDLRHALANRYVIKEIRANLMLEWLASSTGGQIVFVIRHPCAVIGSRMKQTHPYFEADMQEILSQRALVSSFLEPFRKMIAGASSRLHRQTILWCVENFVPLTQARSTDWLVCCYEDFLWNRDEAFGRAFRLLGLEPTAKTKRTKARPVSNPTHDLSAPRPWHAPLTEADGEEVLRICEEFGLRLYGRERFPLCSPRDLFDRGWNHSRELGVRAEPQTQSRT